MFPNFQLLGKENNHIITFFESENLKLYVKKYWGHFRRKQRRRKIQNSSKTVRKRQYCIIVLTLKLWKKYCTFLFTIVKLYYSLQNYIVWISFRTTHLGNDLLHLRPYRRKLENLSEYRETVLKIEYHIYYHLATYIGELTRR